MVVHAPGIVPVNALLDNDRDCRESSTLQVSGSVPFR